MYTKNLKIHNFDLEESHFLLFYNSVFENHIFALFEIVDMVLKVKLFNMMDIQFANNWIGAKLIEKIRYDFK